MFRDSEMHSFFRFVVSLKSGCVLEIVKIDLDLIKYSVYAILLVYNLN